MTRYFFDAHALLGVAMKRPEYDAYRGVPIVTAHGHLYEFVRYAMKVHRARDVLQMAAGLRCSHVHPSDADLVEATKLLRARPRLSTQDALGYILARREGLSFLTGDAGFLGLPGTAIVR